MIRRLILIAAFAFCYLSVNHALYAQETRGDFQSTGKETIAVSDVLGDEKSLTKTLTDALMVTLDTSEQLRTVERNAFQDALLEFNIPLSATLSPSQVRKMGRALEADKLILSQYTLQRERLTVQSRVYDAGTGLSVTGLSVSATGTRRDAKNIAKRLAADLHKKMTGETLVIDIVEEEEQPPARLDTTQQRPAPLEIDSFDRMQEQGLIPDAARKSGSLTERDLSNLVSKLEARLPQTDTKVSITSSASLVSRIHVITAITKMLVSPDDVRRYQGDTDSHTPDFDSVPAWGAPYLSAAVDQGWWNAEMPFRAREFASWGFVASVLSRLPLREERVARDREQPLDSDDREPRRPARRTTPEVEDKPLRKPTKEKPKTEPKEPFYTGLVVDARGLPVRRDRGPRLLDQNGYVVYPEKETMPSLEYIEEHGLASYAVNHTESDRAGKYPLVVRASGVSSNGFDLIVSNDTAKQIRQLNRRDKFLVKCNVTILAQTR